MISDKTMSIHVAKLHNAGNIRAGKLVLKVNLFENQPEGRLNVHEQVEINIEQGSNAGTLHAQQIQVNAQTLFKNVGKITVTGNIALDSIVLENQGGIESSGDILCISKSLVQALQEAKMVSGKKLTLHSAEVKNSGILWGNTVELQAKNIQNFVNAKMGSLQAMQLNSEAVHNAGEIQTRKLTAHLLNLFENSQSGIVQVETILELQAAEFENIGEISFRQANIGFRTLFKNTGKILSAGSNHSLDLPQGLSFQAVPGDGHCLYHAVGLHLGKEQSVLRQEVASYIESHRSNPEFLNILTGLLSGRNLEDYITDIRAGREWADHLEIEILRRVYNRSLVVIGPDGKIRNPGGQAVMSGEPIFVYYNGHDHYDGLLIEQNRSGRQILAELSNRNEQAPRSLSLKGATLQNSGIIQCSVPIQLITSALIENAGSIVGETVHCIVTQGKIQNAARATLAAQNSLELDANHIEQNGELFSDGNIHIKAQQFSHRGRIKAQGNVIIHATDIQSLGEIEADGDIEIHYGGGQWEITDKLKAKGKVRFVLPEGREITQAFNNIVGGLHYELASTATRSLRFLVDQKVRGDFTIKQPLAFTVGSSSQFLSLISEQGKIDIQAPGIFGVNGCMAGMKGVLLKSTAALQLGIPLSATAEDPNAFAWRKANFRHGSLGKKGYVGNTIGVYREPQLKWHQPLCYSMAVMSGGDIVLEGTEVLWNHLEIQGLANLQVTTQALTDISSSIQLHQNACLTVPNLRVQCLTEVENLGGRQVPIGWPDADYAHRRLYEQKSVMTRPAFWSIAGHLKLTGQMQIIGSQVCCATFEGNTPLLHSIVPYFTYANYGLFSSRKDPWWAVGEGIAVGTPFQAKFSPGVLSAPSPSLIVDGIIFSQSIALTEVQQGYIGTGVDFSLPAPRPFRSYVPLMEFEQNSPLFKVTEIGTYPTIYKPILPFQWAGPLGPILVVTPQGLRPNILHRRCLLTPLQEREYLQRALMSELSRGFLGQNCTVPEQALKRLCDNAEHYTQAIVPDGGTAIVPREGNIAEPMMVYEEISFIHASGTIEVALVPVLCIPKAFDNPRLRDWAGGVFSLNGVLMKGASQNDSNLSITGHIDAQGKVTFSTFNQLTQERRMVKTIQHITDTVVRSSLGGLKKKTQSTQREVDIWKAEPGNTTTASEVVYEKIGEVQLAGLTANIGKGGVCTDNVEVIKQRALMETGVEAEVTRDRGLIGGTTMTIHEQTYNLIPTVMNSIGPVQLHSQVGSYDNLVVNGRQVVDSNTPALAPVAHSGAMVKRHQPSNTLNTNHYLVAEGNTVNHGNVQISASQGLIIGETPKKLEAMKQAREAEKREARRTAKRKQRQADIKFIISIPVSYYTAGLVGGLSGASGATLVAIKGATMGFTNALIFEKNPIKGAGEGALFAVVGHGIRQIPFVPNAPLLIQEVVQEVVVGATTGALQTLLHKGNLAENVIIGAVVNGVGALVVPNPQFGTGQEMSLVTAVKRALVEAGVGTVLSNGSERSLLINLATSALGASMGRSLSAKGEEHGRALISNYQQRHAQQMARVPVDHTIKKPQMMTIKSNKPNAVVNHALEEVTQNTVHLFAQNGVELPKSEIHKAFAKHPALQGSQEQVQQNLIQLGKADRSIRDDRSAFAKGCEKVFLAVLDSLVGKVYGGEIENQRAVSSNIRTNSPSNTQTALVPSGGSISNTQRQKLKEIHQLLGVSPDRSEIDKAEDILSRRTYIRHAVLGEQAGRASSVRLSNQRNNDNASRHSKAADQSHSPQNSWKTMEHQYTELMLNTKDPIALTELSEGAFVKNSGSGLEMLAGGLAKQAKNLLDVSLMAAKFLADGSMVNDPYLDLSIRKAALQRNINRIDKVNQAVTNPKNTAKLIFSSLKNDCRQAVHSYLEGDFLNAGWYGSDPATLLFSGPKSFVDVTRKTASLGKTVAVSVEQGLKTAVKEGREFIASHDFISPITFQFEREVIQLNSGIPIDKLAVRVPWVKKDHVKYLEKGVGAQVGKEHIDLKTGSGSHHAYENFEKARAKAIKNANLGEDSVPFLQKAGPHKNKIYTGMKSQDGKRGWRLDFDPVDPNKGTHVNWWFIDPSNKKLMYKGLIKVDQASQHIYWDILSHFPKK